MSDIDEETRNKLKQRYKRETGEELPDHVIDNLDLLTGVDIFDLVEYRASEKLADKR